MTTTNIQLSLLEGMIAANPDKADQLKALYNMTACNELVNEQIEMLESCPKQEAMSEIENVNGLAASEYLK